MSDPSDAAVDLVALTLLEAGWVHHGTGPKPTDAARTILKVAHDPVLRSSRSVCLRDVLDVLDEYERFTGQHTLDASDFVRHRLGAS